MGNALGINKFKEEIAMIELDINFQKRDAGRAGVGEQRKCDNHVTGSGE
jgi:hypothetical protein